MAACEGDECLVGRRAVREVGLEHALYDLRSILRLDVAIELMAERRIGTEAAADEDVVALDRIPVLRTLHFARQKSDLADEMLSAGMVAAGEMDVDWAV